MDGEMEIRTHRGIPSSTTAPKTLVVTVTGAGHPQVIAGMGELKWKMNIDAGLDSGPYHIAVDGNVFTLTYKDAPLGEYSKVVQAYHVANAHMEALKL